MRLGAMPAGKVGFGIFRVDSMIEPILADK
jgi:hypothetical protein